MIAKLNNNLTTVWRRSRESYPQKNTLTHWWWQQTHGNCNLLNGYRKQIASKILSGFEWFDSIPSILAMWTICNSNAVIERYKWCARAEQHQHRTRVIKFNSYLLRNFGDSHFFSFLLLHSDFMYLTHERTCKSIAMGSISFQKAVNWNWQSVDCQSINSNEYFGERTMY